MGFALEWYNGRSRRYNVVVMAELGLFHWNSMLGLCLTIEY